MSFTETLVRSLCDTLWTTITRTAAQDYRFAQWLQMPLPRNDYWDLVRSSSNNSSSGARQTDAGDGDAKRRRTRETSELAAQPRLKAAWAGVRAAAIVTDGRTAMASVDASLGDERMLALRVMEDATRKHFDFSQPGVVPKITQLLLVLALEPCQLSLEFVLRKRFDDDFVVRNFLATAADAVAPEDVVAWHRDVKRMTFNLFGRFPELALVCDVDSDATQLRAVQDLWCIADSVFGKCHSTLHSETAQHFAYDSILCSIAEDRGPLLEAVVHANVHAAGTDPGHFYLRRDLFVEALVCAQLHVLQLHTHATPNSDTAVRLRRTFACLKKTRAAVALFTPRS
jgi:hypothetical protein